MTLLLIGGRILCLDGVFFLDCLLLAKKVPTQGLISSLLQVIVIALFWLLRLGLGLLRLATSRLLVDGLLLGANGRLARAFVLGTNSGTI